MCVLMNDIYSANIEKNNVKTSAEYTNYINVKIGDVASLSLTRFSLLFV